MSATVSPEESINQLVARARQLYTLPAVAVRVLELTSDAAVDHQTLMECIENDPALTTKILRVVNSSLFSPVQRVTSLKQALAMLGMKPLKMLVLGFSLPTNLGASSSSDVLTRYWRHTLLKAVAAREIAEAWFETSGDEPFVTGLLQDLGLLVLIQDLGAPCEEFLRAVWQEGGDLAEEERRVLGFEHKRLTARLLENWLFPPSLIQTIVPAIDLPPKHPAEEQDGARQILNLADLVAALLIDQRPEKLDSLLMLAQKYRRVSLIQIECLMAALQQKAPQLAEILSWELPDELNYIAIVGRAHERLASLADQTTAELLIPPRRPIELLKVDSTSEGMQAAASKDSSPHAAKQTSANSAPPVRADRDVQAVETVATQETSCAWSTRNALISRLGVVTTRCRQSRTGISLVLVDLDDTAEIATACGIEAVPRLVQQLGATMNKIAAGAGRASQIGDARFALILEGSERRHAVELAWQIVHLVRGWLLHDNSNRRVSLSVSIGLAAINIPPRNFPAEELLAAAERCLHGVQLSGGDGVKSIDIF